MIKSKTMKSCIIFVNFLINYNFLFIFQRNEADNLFFKRQISHFTYESTDSIKERFIIQKRWIHRCNDKVYNEIKHLRNEINDTKNIDDVNYFKIEDFLNSIFPKFKTNNRPNLLYCVEYLKSTYNNLNKQLMNLYMYNTINFSYVYSKILSIINDYRHEVLIKINSIDNYENILNNYENIVTKFNTRYLLNNRLKDYLEQNKKNTIFQLENNLSLFLDYLIIYKRILNRLEELLINAKISYSNYFLDFTKKYQLLGQKNMIYKDIEFIIDQDFNQVKLFSFEIRIFVKNLYKSFYDINDCYEKIQESYLNLNYSIYNINNLIDSKPLKTMFIHDFFKLDTIRDLNEKIESPYSFLKILDKTDVFYENFSIEYILHNSKKIKYKYHSQIFRNDAGNHQVLSYIRNLLGRIFKINDFFESEYDILNYKTKSFVYDM